MQASITRILKKHKSKVPLVRDEFALKEAATHAGLETHLSHKGKYGKRATFTLSISKDSTFVVELARVTEVWAADLATLKAKAYTAAIELLDKPNLKIQRIQKPFNTSCYAVVQEGVYVPQAPSMSDYWEPDDRSVFSSAPLSWYGTPTKKKGKSLVKTEIKEERGDFPQGDPKLAEAMQNIEKIQRFLKYGCVYNGPEVNSRATMEKAARRAGVNLTVEKHTGLSYVCVMVFVDSDLCRVKICELNIAKKLNVNEKVVEKKAYKEALKIMQDKDTKVEKIHGEYQMTLGSHSTVWGQASSTSTSTGPTSTEPRPGTSTSSTSTSSTSTGTFDTELNQRVKTETGAGQLNNVVKMERDKTFDDDMCIVLDDENGEKSDTNDQDDIFVL